MRGSLIAAFYPSLPVTSVCFIIFPSLYLSCVTLHILYPNVNFQSFVWWQNGKTDGTKCWWLHHIHSDFFFFYFTFISNQDLKEHEICTQWICLNTNIACCQRVALAANWTHIKLKISSVEQHIHFMTAIFFLFAYNITHTQSLSSYWPV